MMVLIWIPWKHIGGKFELHRVVNPYILA